jgi:hypothetical protein
MTRHAEHVVHLQQFVARRAEDPAVEMDKQLAMELMVKCADISNVVKPVAVARRWALRVTDEFFIQGDAERAMGMEVSATCNRLAISRVALQTGFIDHVAEPLFTLLVAAFPPVRNEPGESAPPREGLDTPLAQLRDNRASYALCTDLDLERARDWEVRDRPRLSLTHTITLTRTHCLSLTHTHTHTPSHSLALSLSQVAPSSLRFGLLSSGEEEGSFSRERSGRKREVGGGLTPSQITTASMSFGVPLLEPKSEFPSYPHYPQGQAGVGGRDGDVEVVGGKAGTRADRGLDPNARGWSAFHLHDDVLG